MYVTSGHHADPPKTNTLDGWHSKKIIGAQPATFKNTRQLLGEYSRMFRSQDNKDTYVTSGRRKSKQEGHGESETENWEIGESNEHSFVR